MRSSGLARCPGAGLFLVLLLCARAASAASAGNRELKSAYVITLARGQDVSVVESVQQRNDAGDGTGAVSAGAWATPGSADPDPRPAAEGAWEEAAGPAGGEALAEVEEDLRMVGDVVSAAEAAEEALEAQAATAAVEAPPAQNYGGADDEEEAAAGAEEEAEMLGAHGRQPEQPQQDEQDEEVVGAGEQQGEPGAPGPLILVGEDSVAELMGATAGGGEPQDGGEQQPEQPAGAPGSLVVVGDEGVGALLSAAAATEAAAAARAAAVPAGPTASPDWLAAAFNKIAAEAFSAFDAIEAQQQQVVAEMMRARMAGSGAAPAARPPCPRHAAMAAAAAAAAAASARDSRAAVAGAMVGGMPIMVRNVPLYIDLGRRGGAQFAVSLSQSQGSAVLVASAMQPEGAAPEDDADEVEDENADGDDDGGDDDDLSSTAEQLLAVCLAAACTGMVVALARAAAMLRAAVADAAADGYGVVCAADFASAGGEDADDDPKAALRNSTKGLKPAASDVFLIGERAGAAPRVAVLLPEGGRRYGGAVYGAVAAEEQELPAGTPL